MPRRLRLRDLVQFMWIWLSILVANWRFELSNGPNTGFGMLDQTSHWLNKRTWISWIRIVYDPTPVWRSFQGINHHFPNTPRKFTSPIPCGAWKPPRFWNLNGLSCRWPPRTAGFLFVAMQPNMSLANRLFFTGCLRQMVLPAVVGRKQLYRLHSLPDGILNFHEFPRPKIK